MTLPRVQAYFRGAVARPINNLARILLIFFFDLQAVVAYGRSAPRKYQLLYIPPHLIQNQHAKENIRHLHKCVIGGDWDQHPTRKYKDTDLYQIMKKRIQQGAAFPETGAFERMKNLIGKHGSFDGVATAPEIEQRYKCLDNIIDEAQTKRRLRTQKELRFLRFREKGGINVVITRRGEVRKIGNGNHRLMIALLLDLPQVPVSVFAVHPQALKNGTWNELRQRSRKLEAKKPHRNNPYG